MSGLFSGSFLWLWCPVSDVAHDLCRNFFNYTWYKLLLFPSIQLTVKHVSSWAKTLNPNDHILLLQLLRCLVCVACCWLMVYHWLLSCVPSFSRVLDTGEDGQGAEGQVAAMYGWSDHTLPVTGLLAGSGGSSAIVVSCSLDHTCKVILQFFTISSCRKLNIFSNDNLFFPLNRKGLMY